MVHIWLRSIARLVRSTIRPKRVPRILSDCSVSVILTRSEQIAGIAIVWLVMLGASLHGACLTQSPCELDFRTPARVLCFKASRTARSTTGSSYVRPFREAGFFFFQLCACVGRPAAATAHWLPYGTDSFAHGTGAASMASGTSRRKSSCVAVCPTVLFSLWPMPLVISCRCFVQSLQFEVMPFAAPDFNDQGCGLTGCNRQVF